MENTHEPTNAEIMGAVNNLVGTVNSLTGAVDNLVSIVGGLVGTLRDLGGTVNDLATSMNVFATNTEERLARLEKNDRKSAEDITYIKATMVTKDYLDRKVDQIKEENNRLLMKEDERVSMLIGVLYEKDVINRAEVGMLEELQPLRAL